MKISFIIPAYNSAATLQRCLDSILRQPFNDCEIIIVNDGSTDATQQIIDLYKTLDSRVFSITQANAGQGAARSLGLKQATGDYIWFVDSDDWLLPSVMPRINRILSQLRPDVFVANFEYSFDDKAAMPSSLVPGHLVGEMIHPTVDVHTFAAVSCWNTPPWRLIATRKHLLEHKIEFEHGVFYEDHPFAIHLMLTANRVYVDGSISYSYYQRQDSTTKVNDRKAMDFLTVRKSCLDLFEKYGQRERLGPIVAGYIAPINFFNAHVADAYKVEFLHRLHDETSKSDVEFARLHGDEGIKAFADALESKSHDFGKNLLQGKVRRNRYTLAGAKRFAKRIRAGLIRRLVQRAIKIKNTLAGELQHSGVDLSGQRFLRAGTGTRLEALYIDVRVNIEDRPYVNIGEYSHVGGTFVFERGLGDITIGNRSSIGGGCKLICTQEGGIHIGNNVMLSWDCTVMDSDSHSLNPEVRASDAYDWKAGVDANRIGAYKDWSQVASAPIRIDDNVWVGFETAILKGVHIGKGAVIGARSMVTRDVAPFCIYAGTPARFIGFVPRDTWSWEEIIHASQGNPKDQQMLMDAYLHKDLLGSLNRFRATEEFSATLQELRKHAPEAKTIIDIGGAGGVMSVALALEGYSVTLAEPSSDNIVGTQAAEKLVRLACESLDPTVKDRITIRQTSVESLDGSQLFDIAYCRQVVHHFRDPVKALQKVNDNLNVGGVALLVREHIIFDDEDKTNFLLNHPFHKYSGGENGYRADEYESFIQQAKFELLETLVFAGSPINYFPHTKEVAESISEQEIAGRPYTFIAKKSEVHQ
ncbi:glycosyltransferase [Pseudomonas helvetica]|uniref:glycosyltransferase n=1 Tax=Pseudomonas helvetica TaxID=3136738 RepID=UPI00326485CA